MKVMLTFLIVGYGLACFVVGAFVGTVCITPKELYKIPTKTEFQKQLNFHLTDEQLIETDGIIGKQTLLAWDIVIINQVSREICEQANKN